MGGGQVNLHVASFDLPKFRFRRKSVKSELADVGARQDRRADMGLYVDCNDSGSSKRQEQWTIAAM